MAHKILPISLIVGLLACTGLGPPPDIIPQPPAPNMPGVQTHFDALVSPEHIEPLAGWQWAYARVDVQRADAYTANAIVQQVKEAGLRPLAIIRDAQQMLELPDDIDFELRNEPDLEGPPPQVYRGLMLDIARLADGRRVWVGAVSNFNERGFDYLRKLGTIPPNLGVSIHNYGDGEFAPTEAKYAHFIGIIGERQFAITEFGYPTEDIPELQVARLVREEHLWWAAHGARFSIMYQLNDGPNDGESYGLRRMDGSWKPTAFIWTENNVRFFSNVWGK